MKKAMRFFLCLMGFASSVFMQTETQALKLIINVLNKHVACLSGSIQGDIALKNACFKDSKIQTCADLIESGDNLKPLKSLWTEAQSENSIDEKFIREFSLLLFLSYESIIEQLNGTQVVKSSWFAIISLYAQLSNLPLSKLFEALELCWKRYQYILQGYEVNGVYSLKKWVEEYWWVIPTTIAFIAVSFARWQEARIAQ